MRQIILDTETTGLRVEDGNRILEIAAVEMIDRRLSSPDRHFHCYINPGRDSEEGALNVHGLTTEFLSDKPKFAQIADEFLDFVAGAEIIIHNAPFDVGYLNMELGKIGRGKFTDHVANVIDTLVMAKDQRPGKRNNLDALCDFFDIDRSNRTLHGALIDCELLSEVYLGLTRGQDSLLIDFDPYAGNDAALAFAKSNRKPLRIIKATPEERAEHEAYLAVLDKSVKGECLWRQMEKGA
ncbi:DNA polymerase III subunit epsilon [Iodobacter sp. LRB]|uniref:DNA polymerase III subunit epsilon n=1 Tax=Iodobacter fluviatilis TaxID=537 RepID=A0A377SVH6_9NEIS|nr:MULTISPECIES: DNA polymerase III subunit epsilon [Iodobacter]PHV00435.1 DNA polymerase III subunit epsilon [Iodobacter sp. BJB302]TCU81141.1 DNA polymerase-3 subunit epsilon [Iodobacter fluviatilis]STR46021.1 DNA polymerase III subunit epsilon [Iodobacter fluviatilis]